jgi:hypothetical protein
MCREGVDLTTLKVSLKHAVDRLKVERDHLRQWSALAANVNLEELAEKLRKGSQQLEETESLIGEAIGALMELQMHGHIHEHGSGKDITITPV